MTDKLISGVVTHESVHCISVQKTYPSGNIGNVTYRLCDVRIERDGDKATLYRSVR